MKNPYKRTDVFICNFSAHARFEHKVSVHHVLKVKKCFPQGCFYFKWFCIRKNKGQTCVRKFNYIGRLCEGCTHFRDEKMHYQPRINLSALEFERFKQELDAFEEWYFEIQGREVNLWCEVDSIKPRFNKQISDGKGHLRLEGYLLILKTGFMDTTEFDDYFYITISPQQQERLRIAPGDQLSARGNIKMDRGRVLFPKIWGVDIEKRSGDVTWNNSRALIARQSASCFVTQPAKCINCPQGALVDTVERRGGRIQQYRELFCLAGIAAPEECYIQISNEVDLCLDLNEKNE